MIHRLTLQAEGVAVDVERVQRAVALQRLGQQARARVARQVAAHVQHAQAPRAAQRVQQPVQVALQTHTNLAGDYCADDVI